VLHISKNRAAICWETGWRRWSPGTHFPVQLARAGLLAGPFRELVIDDIRQITPVQPAHARPMHPGMMSALLPRCRA
jgi:hypothetical protein